MAIRAIRGATCLAADNSDEMAEAVGELLAAMFDRNSIDHSNIISLFFTGTPDLTCAFPAAGARLHGLPDVPLMCASEMNIVGALERVVRIMAHVETDKSRDEITHVYLRGADVLRPDLNSENRDST